MKFSILWKNELLADIETETRKSEVKIKKYDPWKMVQITHGVDWDDFCFTADFTPPGVGI